MLFSQNNLPQRLFGQNIKKSGISRVSPDSRKLQELALKTTFPFQTNVFLIKQCAKTRCIKHLKMKNKIADRSFNIKLTLHISYDRRANILTNYVVGLTNVVFLISFCHMGDPIAGNIG